MHCFQQKGEITNCVHVKCQETGGKKKSTVTIIISLSSPEYFNLKEIDGVYFFKKNFFPIESVSTHNYPLDLSLAVFCAFVSNFVNECLDQVILCGHPFDVKIRWMKLEPIIQSEVSQKGKHQHSILTHIYGI